MQQYYHAELSFRNVINVKSEGEQGESTLLTSPMYKQGTQVPFLDLR